MTTPNTQEPLNQCTRGRNDHHWFQHRTQEPVDIFDFTTETDLDYVEGWLRTRGAPQ